MKAKRTRILLSAILSAALLFSLTACGGQAPAPSAAPESESISLAPVTETPESSAQAPAQPQDSKPAELPTVNPLLELCAGYYKLVGMVAGGTDQSDQIPTMEQLGMYALIELKDDGTGVLDMFGSPSELTWDGTTASIDDDPADMTADGTTVTFAHGTDTLLTFERITDEEYAAIVAGAAAQGGDSQGGGSQGGSATGTTLGNDECNVTFLGAEQAKNYDGADAIRIWYEYTNLSDKVVTPNNVLDFKAVQGGEELKQVWFYEDEIDFLSSGDAAIRPGVTVRGCAGFACNYAGGPIDVKATDFWEETTFLDETIDPKKPQAVTAPEYEIVEIPDVDWLDDVTDDGDYDEKYHVYIGDCDVADDYDDNQMLRIYFDFTNNSDEAISPFMALYFRAMQDGIQMETGTPVYDQQTDEDDALYNDVEPGQTVTFAVCFKLRTGNAVSVELYDFWTGDIVLGASYSRN